MRARLTFLALCLLGTGAANAAFTVAWTAPITDDNRGIAWADLNNDCYPDIIAVNNEPGTCVRIFRNNGDGTFTLVYTSTLADRCTAVAAADYDGDGFIDFAVSNYSNIPSRIYHNDGGFNFTNTWSEPYAEYSTGVDWGDYDNDGRPDLIINSLSASGVRFFHNDGGGAFSDAGLITTPGNAASTRFADYDNDGFLDVFEGVTGYGSIIWKGNGTAGPANVCTLPWNNNDDSDWKDFDGDGKLDLIETDYVTIFRNAGGNSFPNYWSNGVTAYSMYVRGSDYDGDGLADFAMANWAPNNFYIVHNAGGASFVTLVGPSATDGPVAWADYDRDGRPDVVGGCFQGPYMPIVVYRNNGAAMTPGPCAAYTATQTPTSTASFTPTSTFTQTLTPASTSTPTGTPTSTPTPSFTPTITNTPTITATLPPVPSPTPPCEPHAWPNPFNPHFAVWNRFRISCVPDGASASFYTISGELVLTVPGSQGMAEWNGTNTAGQPVAPGIYFYAVKSGGSVLSKGKILLTNNP